MLVGERYADTILRSSKNILLPLQLPVPAAMLVIRLHSNTSYVYSISFYSYTDSESGKAGMCWACGQVPSTQVMLTYSFASEACLLRLVVMINDIVIGNHIGGHLTKVNRAFFISIAQRNSEYNARRHKIVSCVADRRLTMENRSRLCRTGPRRPKVFD
jgi:hypothetical protein